jgi:hypothetical protein
MKKLFIAAAIAAMALTTTACGQRIKFDEAAVEVVESGSKKGVQEQEITTGRYWNHPFSYRYIVKFPTTLQTYSWDSKSGCFNFINADSVRVSQCISLVVKIDPAQADNLVRLYKGSISKGGGEDGYVLDDIISGPVQREIQTAFSYNGGKYTSAQLYADNSAALIESVSKSVSAKFAKDGIIIQQIMPNGVPSLPEDIVESIKGALKAKTDAARADAELARTIAEGNKQKAQADADAYVTRTKAAAITANPAILKQMEIENSRGLCPINATTCVIGASALQNLD